MQRVILLTLILLSAALPPGAAAAPDVTLEFWTISLQPFFTDYVNGMIATYERTHPGIRIRWVDVQFAAIEQKLLASLAGGGAPAPAQPEHGDGHPLGGTGRVGGHGRRCAGGGEEALLRGPLEFRPLSRAQLRPALVRGAERPGLQRRPLPQGRPGSPRPAGPPRP